MAAKGVITFLTSSMRLSGGVLVLAHHANGLVERGYRVTFVTSAGGVDAEVQEKLSPKIGILSARISLEEAATPVPKFLLAWQMVRLVPPSDILIATHTPAVVPAMLARSLRRRRARMIWLHQDYPEMFEGRPLEQWLLRRAPSWFDSVVTVSQACADEIERTSGVQARVVPQGYSIGGKLPEQVVRPEGEKVIMYLGDKRPRKGWDDFMAAIRLVYEQHPDIRLAIVSKDPGPLETPARYDLYHRPSWEQIAELYRSCHLFVASSWWEGFGRPPLEAMAWGVPVVMTDSRGVREYARHEVNCLLTPIQNPAALAEAINRVLRDPVLAESLASSGRDTALEFTWERAVAQFIRVIEDES
ncbi:MAG: glycosyltransferase family 4 protein [Anaerolineae bacterium]|nr:glycosyltransferase family 4 protein [Anaerolineae bacterium]